MLPQWMMNLPELDILPVPAQAPRRRRKREPAPNWSGASCTVPLCDGQWAVLVYDRRTGALLARICDEHGREL